MGWSVCVVLTISFICCSMGWSWLSTERIFLSSGCWASFNDLSVVFISSLSFFTPSSCFRAVSYSCKKDIKVIKQAKIINHSLLLLYKKELLVHLFLLCRTQETRHGITWGCNAYRLCTDCYAYIYFYTFTAPDKNCTAHHKK